MFDYFPKSTLQRRKICLILTIVLAKNDENRHLEGGKKWLNSQSLTHQRANMIEFVCRDCKLSCIINHNVSLTRRSLISLKQINIMSKTDTVDMIQLLPNTHGRLDNLFANNQSANLLQFFMIQRSHCRHKVPTSNLISQL